MAERWTWSGGGADGPIVYVHVVSTDHDPAAAMRLLSEEELGAAGRFRFEADRRRYAIAHAALRLILSERLAIEPAAVRFAVGPFGKPHVSGIEFSLSHSGDLALVATGAAPLGVDVEQLRSIDIMALAARYFSAAETQALRALSPDALLKGFFACWSRKEAFIKATGEGLTRPLDQFDVSVGPVAALIATRPDRGEAGRWTMQRLDVSTDYAAALCVRGSAAPAVCMVDFGDALY